MVSYFLRWTLLKFFSSFPNEQSKEKIRQLGRITCAVINTSNEVKCPLLWKFWIYNFSRRNLERIFVGSIINIRNECHFFWIHGEQTNRTRTASRFTRFVCPAQRFIPPWTPQIKHSFLKNVISKLYEIQYFTHILYILVMYILPDPLALFSFDTQDLQQN